MNRLEKLIEEHEMEDTKDYCYEERCKCVCGYQERAALMRKIVLCFQSVVLQVYRKDATRIINDAVNIAIKKMEER